MTPLPAAIDYGKLWQIGFGFGLHVLALLPLGLVFISRWPAAAGLVSSAAERHRVRSLLAGVTMVLAIALLGAATQQVKLLGVALVIALVAAAGFAFVGLLSEARRTGLSLLGRPRESEGVQAGATTLGWVILAAAGVVAGVGIVVVSYLVLRGAGAALLAAAARRGGDTGQHA